MADTVSVPATPVQAPAATPAQPANVSVTPQPGKPAGPKNPLGGRVEVTRAPAPAPAQTQPDQAAPAARPAWLPEKFKSPEDLAQAYTQLEQRLGQPAAPAVEPAREAGGATEKPAGAPIARGLVDKMTQEYASTGQVSAQLRQEWVEKTGLEETFIDNQIAHIRAQGARASEMAVQRLGGDSAVRELMDWAGKRLSQEERAAFNRAVYSGDEALARFAVDGLTAKYEMEVGRSPRVMAGRKPQEEYAGIQPFQSHDEWGRARKDPRYKTDPAYRQEVEDRLRIAVKLGLIPA